MYRTNFVTLLLHKRGTDLLWACSGVRLPGLRANQEDVFTMKDIINGLIERFRRQHVQARRYVP